MSVPPVRPTLLVVAALALMTVLRFLHLSQLEENSVLFTHPTVDALEYYTEAAARAENRFEYQVPIHAPLYPVLLGLEYGACGGDPFELRLRMSLVGVLAGLLLYLGGSVLLGFWPAAAATCLFALYRPALLYECEFYAAGLANLWVTAAAVLLVCAVRGPRLLTVVALGLTVGLAAITRSNLLVLTPVAAVALVVCQRAWLRAGALVLAALLPIAVVTTYNHAASGEWIPIQARTGHNLYQANHPGSDGTVDIRPGPAFESFRRRPMVAADAWGPGPESRYYAELFFRFVREHPGEFLELLLSKFWNSLSPCEMASSYDNELNSEYSSVLRLPLPGFAWLLPLVLVGLFLPARPSREYKVAMAVLGAIWLCLVFGYAAGRYRYQAAGLTCLFAAAGLQSLWCCWRDRGFLAARRHPRLLALGLLLLGVLVLCLAPRFTEQRVRWRAEYRQLQSLAYLGAGDLRRAREHALRAVRIDRDAAWPHFSLGVLATYGKDGKQGGAGADLGMAIRRYTEAIRLWPDFPEALQNRAWVHFRRGDPMSAALDFAKAAELVPYRYQTWEDLAKTYEKLARKDAAAAARKRAEEEKAKWPERKRTQPWSSGR